MEELNWHKIYTQLSPKLLGICRRYIKDLATAEDIVQDSFIVAIQKESSLKNKDSVNGWLSRIVVNNAINYLKNENKISFSSTQDFEIVDETTMTNTLELDRKSALLAADFKPEDLLEAIDLLPENHKSVFNLYIIDQFSHLEISSLLKISVGTSKSSLSRARKTVQEILIKKLNGDKTDEKKKRRIAFLLFFGLENQLFANYFRKSFSNFEIQPKRSLDLSRKSKNSMIDFNLNPSKVFPYLKLGVLLFGLAIFVFYLMRNENNEVSNNNEIVTNEIVTDTIQKVIAKNDSVNKKLLVEPKTELIEKKSVHKETKSTSVAKVIQSKITDSVDKKEPQKVVVIKKQIVKKDTVYVQR